MMAKTVCSRMTVQAQLASQRTCHASEAGQLAKKMGHEAQASRPVRVNRGSTILKTNFSKRNLKQMVHSRDFSKL